MELMTHIHVYCVENLKGVGIVQDQLQTPPMAR